ncbi:MAG: M13 family metallopeptidase [Burkholderiaceae bacterium]|nr:M13 family metallopeptidase [Burkholderiaceae bacterium]
MASNAVAQTATSNNLVLESHAMDLSADVCRDFFQYANGNWLKNNPIPADRARYSAYDEVTERNLKDLRLIVEEAAANPNAQGIAQLVGAYYRSGIDESRLNAQGFKPLAEKLAEIDVIKDRKQILSVVALHHRTGTRSLFNFFVDQDAKNTTRYLAQLAQGGLGLPDRDYYLKSDKKTAQIRQKYQAYVTQIFSLMGDDASAAQQHARAVLKLETQLAKASLTKVELRDPQASYHLSSVSNLEQMGVNWKTYFDTIGLTNAKELNLAHPKFFKEVSRIVQTESLANLKTYLRWQLVNSKAKDLSTEFVNTQFDFYGRTLAGTKELQPRWKRVLTSIDANVGEALGELYVNKFFAPKAKAGVLAMVDEIKLAMRDSISKLRVGRDSCKKTQILL